MCRSYLCLLEAGTNIINGQAFNIGFENHSVAELANIVKENIDQKIELEKVATDDNRSYHVSSDKIKKLLNFDTKFTISDAVNELKLAFEKNYFKDPLNNEDFYNIKKCSL